MPAKKRASSPTGSSSAKKPTPLKGRASANGPTAGDDSDIGEYEDEWGDDYDSESASDDDDAANDPVAGGADPDEADEDVDEAGAAVDGMDLDAGEPAEPATRAYLPGLGQGEKLAEDEELVPDMSSYVVLHHARIAWPCLSFDVLRDNLGAHRMKPPFSACVVAGTQADSGAADANELVVMQWQNLSRARADDSDGSDDSDSDDEGEAGAQRKGDATLVYRSIPHVGGVNRVRARFLRDLGDGPPEPPDAYHVATFADTGKVHIFDVAPHLQSILAPASAPPAAASSLPRKPLHTVTSHGRTEGFALAWGPPLASASSARLLSGDCDGRIFLTTLTPAAFTPSPQAFTSHAASVEDLQWSPEELTVFASCSADRSVRIWDVRVKGRKSVLALDGAHESDVNVLSWNAASKFLLLTGGDEGALRVWDLRQMKAAGAGGGRAGARPAPVAGFDWHKAPITSVEWCPTDESAFLASAADDSVTLWDLAVEVDDDDADAALAKGAAGAADRAADVPAQLLFVHQGADDVKEAHWHPQIPGLAISTAANGFDVFKTISV